MAGVLLREPLRRGPKGVSRRPRLSLRERARRVYLERGALSVAVLPHLLFVTCVEINQWIAGRLTLIPRTRKVENDDLNRRASAMSIELVRRRSSINYDNLPVNRV